MAESTLSLGYNDYLSKVSSFLGWGRGAAFGDTPYSPTQQALLDDCVQSGIRNFYFPTPPYDWSFLHPVVTQQIPIGASTIQLPDDFGGFEGEITIVSSGTQVVPWAVRLHNEGEVRKAYAACPTAQGPPEMASLQPLKGTTTQRSSREQLYIYPMADQAYRLQFQYYILPDYISPPYPFVYGGAAHVETILESCLAIAEQRLDDVAGLHTQKFAERMMASMGQDRKNKPAVVGYNRDRSDDRHFMRPWLHGWIPAGTYNGGSFE